MIGRFKGYKIFNQVSAFVTQNNLLDSNQSGYRSGHSSKTVLLSVVEALKPETHCTIFGCPRRKIGIMKQSWPIRNRCNCFTMPVFHLGQPKIVQCVSALRLTRADSKSSILILLDLSTAFDTVNHQILLSTQLAKGISGTALQWFES